MYNSFEKYLINERELGEIICIYLYFMLYFQWEMEYLEIFLYRWNIYVGYIRYYLW